jgi:hypothetical protein
MIPQRDLWRRAVSAGLVVLAPAPAFAQAAAGAKTTPPPTWRLQLSADGTWYENPYFLGGGAASNWSTSGQATLGYERRFRTGSFSLSGSGGAIYYPEIGDFTQPTYGGALGLAWAPSRRTQLRLGESYQRSSTRYLRALDVEGLPLPTSGVNNATSSAGLTHELSAHYQLGLDGSYTWRRYDDDQLVGGEQLSATFQLARRLGKRGSLYLSYGYSTSWFASGRTGSHQVLLGGRKQAEKGVGFELAGGAGYVESTGSWYPSGRAGLNAHGRRTSFSLLYYRDFGQAFGYGRQVIGDIGSASFGWTPARRLSFNAGYNLGYRRDPADETYTILSSIASAGFAWQVAKGLGLSAGYGWERNDTEGQPVVEGGRATASLSYGVDWR